MRRKEGHDAEGYGCFLWLHLFYYFPMLSDLVVCYQQLHHLYNKSRLIQTFILIQGYRGDPGYPGQQGYNGPKVKEKYFVYVCVGGL